MSLAKFCSSAFGTRRSLPRRGLPSSNYFPVTFPAVLLHFIYCYLFPPIGWWIRFIFDYLDHAAYGEDALEQFEMQHMLMGKDQHKGLQVNDRVALEEEMLSRKKKKGKAKGSSATGGKKGFGWKHFSLNSNGSLWLFKEQSQNFVLLTVLFPPRHFIVHSKESSAR